MTKRRTRLLLIEGIPGSGKTTTAEWIYNWLGHRGIDAEWSSELREDHPVIDRALWKTSRRPDYAARCIGRWHSFASKVASTRSPAVHVLEGCLFQGTVRFLLEHDHPEDAPERYFAAAQSALEALQPRIIYLHQRDARDFLEHRQSARKGTETIEKIAAYTETTAIAKRHGWKGIPGMIEFYLHYRTVCDHLLDQTRFEILRLDTSDDDWAARQATLADWLSHQCPSATGPRST